MDTDAPMNKLTLLASGLGQANHQSGVSFSMIPILHIISHDLRRPVGWEYAGA